MPLRPDQPDFFAPRAFSMFSNVHWPDPEVDPTEYYLSGHINGTDSDWPGDDVFLNYAPGHVDDDYFGQWRTQGDGLGGYADQGTMQEFGDLDPEGTFELYVRGTWHYFDGGYTSWRVFSIEAGSVYKTFFATGGGNDFELTVPLTYDEAREMVGLDGYKQWTVYMLDHTFTGYDGPGYVGHAIWKMGVVGPQLGGSGGGTPGLPENVLVEAQPGQVFVAWEPPSDTGSSAIDSYSVGLSPTGATAELDIAYLNENGYHWTFPDLEPGTYTVSLVAHNDAGYGPIYSSAEVEVVAPDAPTTAPEVTVVQDSGLIKVYWTAAEPGSTPITSYLLQFFPADDLENGVGYAELPADQLSQEDYWLNTDFDPGAELVVGVVARSGALEGPYGYSEPFINGGDGDPDPDPDPGEDDFIEVVRWTLREGASGPTVALPFNPNTMSSPTLGRRMSYASGSRAADAEQMRGFEMAPDGPASWTWGGVILTKAHYDLLLEWAKKSLVLRVTDHLDRTFEVIIEKYDPVERLPTPRRAWRADYTMTCMLLKEIA